VPAEQGRKRIQPTIPRRALIGGVGNRVEQFQSVHCISPRTKGVHRGKSPYQRGADGRYAPLYESRTIQGRSHSGSQPGASLSSIEINGILTNANDWFWHESNRSKS